MLMSTMQPVEWPTADLEADRLPEDDVNSGRLGHMSDPLHGIHACLPWCSAVFLSKPTTTFSHLRLFAVGAVDLQGKVVEHVDGVVRAERVTILALRLVDVCLSWDTVSTTQVGERRLSAPCGHTDYHAVSGIYTDYWALRRRCASTSSYGDPSYGYGCDGYKEAVDYETPYNVPKEIKLTRSVTEIEQQLRQRYEVPRLPDAEGPWPYPWGSGPELKPGSEDDEQSEFTD